MFGLAGGGIIGGMVGWKANALFSEVVRENVTADIVAAFFTADFLKNF